MEKLQENINQDIDIPGDPSIEITNKIKSFVKENEEEIINFYKAWIINLSGPYLEDKNVRFIPDHFNIVLGSALNTNTLISCYVLMVFVEHNNKLLIPTFNEFTMSSKEVFNINVNNRQIFFGTVNDKLRFGNCIATFDKDGFKNESLNNTQSFYCDNCQKAINIGGFICETCNFDVCEECSKNITHDHSMFRYNGFYRVSFINIDDILIHLRYDIKNKKIV